MKRFLPFLSLAIVFAACSSKPTETEVKTVQSTTQSNNADTAGLAQFQQWKAQNELTAATDVQTEGKNPAPAEPVKTVTVIRERVIERSAPVRRQPVVQHTPVPEPQPATTESNSGNGDVVTNNTGSSTTGEEPAVTPQPTAKKEGWSKAAKGAVIGGAGGAVLGAIINKKNPAVGAAIGGVLGGAVGYGIGKNKDKKDIQ
ncbi:MAG: hypothetical protein EON98_07395 [Chitinophagaceae bacterium]|nr:MAG: hypothetical protein EON98_07395 [Chitinophagaceae bacterium]